MPNSKKKFLIIGEVFVDTHLDDFKDNEGYLVRLGGIFHSARAFQFLPDCSFDIAYYASEYLDTHISNISKKIGCTNSFKLGQINGSPNIMLIQESREIGDQKYSCPLEEHSKIEEFGELHKILEENEYTDILVFPGKYRLSDLIDTMNDFKVKVHLDINYLSEVSLLFKIKNLNTVFLSSTKALFDKIKIESKKDLTKYFGFFKSLNIIIKDNRGGSCLIQLPSEYEFEAPCYPVKNIHSVGVGDVFDTVFLGLESDCLNKKMKLSSFYASKYAETFNPKPINLKEAEIAIQFSGNRISWFERGKINIYMAAPDFPSVDTTLLKKLTSSLEYHNFKARLPIQENGLIENSLSSSESLPLFEKDYQLLQACQIMIATLLFNDPGTLVEIGVFFEMKKPVILFDPHNLATNMFLRNSNSYICNSISDTIDALFELSSNLKKGDLL